MKLFEKTLKRHIRYIRYFWGTTSSHVWLCHDTLREWFPEVAEANRICVEVHDQPAKDRVAITAFSDDRWVYGYNVDGDVIDHWCDPPERVLERLLANRDAVYAEVWILE